MMFCRILFLLLVVEVVMFPGQTDGPGAVRKEEPAIGTAYLPALQFLIELDRRRPLDFQETNRSQINQFGVEAPAKASVIERQDQGVHLPRCCCCFARWRW